MEIIGGKSKWQIKPLVITIFGINLVGFVDMMEEEATPQKTESKLAGNVDIFLNGISVTAH